MITAAQLHASFDEWNWQKVDLDEYVSPFNRRKFV